MKRKKILFVCTGNTCRSPMAEMILRAKIKKRKIKWWDVGSCGVHAQLGGDIAGNAKLALAEAGYAVKPKFAPRQLTQKLIEGSTLVVTMSERHRQMLEGCGRVVCISRFCGREVPDPFGGDAEIYRLTRDALESACDKIIDEFILNYKDS